MMYNDRQEYEYECERAAQAELERQAEIDQLRDLLRWRKWPEERPEKSGEYFVFKTYPNGRDWEIEQAGLTIDEDDGEYYWPFECFTHWRPLGPLPEDM